MGKIKVVFIQDQLVCGGAEQALFDLIGLLDKEKFSVSVFVHEPGGPWDRKFWDAGIEVHYDYSCRRPTKNPVRKLGNFRKKLAVNEAKKAECAGLLDICCPDADILVSYSTWIGDEAGFSQHAKSVRYIHGDVGTNPEFREIVLKRKDQMGRYDRIVCVSKAAEASFRSLLGRNCGVEMHYNPIDSEEVRRKAEIPVELPKEVPLICAVGRLSAEKGFERLLVVHKRLLDQGIRHNLVIVGDGPDREFLLRLVHALEVEDSVILAGYQSNPYPYMKNSKFMVNSSFTEGLPVIAMEALCLGTPILATVPSVEEAFGGEPCGLIAENSMDGLERGIRKMLTDETFYSDVKVGAQRRSAWFDGKTMVREIEEMFLNLCQEK